MQLIYYIHNNNINIIIKINCIIILIKQNIQGVFGMAKKLNYFNNQLILR